MGELDFLWILIGMGLVAFSPLSIGHLSFHRSTGVSTLYSRKPMVLNPLPIRNQLQQEQKAIVLLPVKTTQGTDSKGTLVNIYV